MINSHMYDSYELYMFIACTTYQFKWPWFIFIFTRWPFSDCSIGSSVWCVPTSDCVLGHPEGWVSAEESDWIYPEQHREAAHLDLQKVHLPTLRIPQLFKHYAEWEILRVLANFCVLILFLWQGILWNERYSEQSLVLRFGKQEHFVSWIFSVAKEYK